MFKRIFRNKNLAILGVYILMFCSLGFFTMMYQFWPSGYAFIQGTFIFFLLYVRLSNLIGENKPSKKEVRSNMILPYVLITITFISSLFTHSLVAMVLLVSFLWVFLVYFIKDRVRGIDFLLLCGLFGVFLIFYIFDISTGHFNILSSFFRLPWYYLLGIFTVLGFGIVLLVFVFKRKISFTKGRFEDVITGKSSRISKFIEDKLIVPFTIGIVHLPASQFGWINHLFM